MCWDYAELQISFLSSFFFSPCGGGAGGRLMEFFWEHFNVGMNGNVVQYGVDLQLIILNTAMLILYAVTHWLLEERRFILFLRGRCYHWSL